MVKVSVLITTFNLEKYIETTLHSVISQITDFDYEILIGDDGSTDQTLSVISKVEKQTGFPLPVYTMSRDANRNYNPIYRASRNRINLISHAKGEYITFLDGDDFYIDDHLLQKQVHVLDKDESLIGCSCALMLYQEKTKKLIAAESSILEQGVIDSKKYWSSQKWFHAECCLFRNIFKKSRLHMSRDYFDDNLIVFYFMQYGGIFHLAPAMVAYRQNPTPWKRKNNLSQILYNAMDYYEELRIDPSWRRASFLRHKKQFWMLWEKKNELASKKYDEEEKISQRRACRFVHQLFHYQELSALSKIRCFLFAQLCRRDHLTDLFL